MADLWKIIDLARVDNKPITPSASPEALKRVLDGLPTADVQDFLHEFDRKHIELNRWDLWDAGYVIHGGMSDDGFHYFRSWIIGKGRDCFEVALRNPEGLVPFLDNLEVDNELLEYVALEVLESRGIDPDPRDGIDGVADGEPLGERFDEDTVESRYPALAKLWAPKDPGPVSLWARIKRLFG